MSGRVVLVGAGPGDPDLITVAGLKAIRGADVVVHDRLIPRELLAAAPLQAEIIDVGKRPKPAGARGDLRGSTPDDAQERINALLVDRARRGLRVVRLKGGDPFVFGRGGEEIDALHAAGVSFDLIPGVSAATAAAALMGIPLTDRRRASSFTVVTGHEAESGAPRINWTAIVQTGGSIVVLMGWRALPEIRRRLIAAGLDPTTAAAAVAAASTPQQRSLMTTLGELPDAVRSAGLRPPLTMVIGGAAAPARSDLREARPLHGRRILVTRPAHSAPALAALLRAQGAAPVIMPAIELYDADPAPIHAAADRLRGGGYGGIVFTSVNGVKRFMACLREAGGDARSLAGAHLAAIGPATAAALARHGLRADLIPLSYTSATLLEALRAEPLAGRHILLPRAARGSTELSGGLRRAGAIVDDIAVYDVQPAPADPDVLEQLGRGEIDTVAFTAPSTVAGLLAQAGRELLTGVEIASIGPATSAAVRAAGFTVPIEAAVHTMQGLVDAIAAASQPRHDEP